MTAVAMYNRRRRLRLLGWATVVLLVGLFVFTALRTTHDPMSVFSWDAVETGAQGIWRGWRATILNPWYLGLVVVLIVAERRFAAERGAGVLSVGGANDFVWLLAFPFTSATIVALWLTAVDAIFFDGFDGTVIDLPEYVTLPVAIAIAFLVGDFLNWFTHYVRHKVPTFWYFHAVHHSQPQMGVFTDFRVHFMETVIAATLIFVPTQLLGIEGRIGIVLAFSTLYFTAFTHANLRTNLGPLRWVLVTPQFHRAHHGYAPEFIDVNFGTALSIWDRMLGTAYTRDEDEYCRTGIADPEFPLTRDGSVGEVVGSYVRQNVYPFKQCVDDFKAFELGRGRPEDAPEPRSDAST